MKRIFNKNLSLVLICFFAFELDAFCAPKDKQEIYQLTIYQYTTTAQETRILI